MPAKTKKTKPAQRLNAAQKSQSVMQAMMQMKKIDIKALQEAYDQA